MQRSVLEIVGRSALVRCALYEFGSGGLERERSENVEPSLRRLTLRPLPLALPKRIRLRRELSEDLCTRSPALVR